MNNAGGISAVVVQEESYPGHQYSLVTVVVLC